MNQNKNPYTTQAGNAENNVKQAPIS